MAWKPASSSPKRAGPTASIVERPIAESIEYLPPTQSQKPNAFAGSIRVEAPSRLEQVAPVDVRDEAEGDLAIAVRTEGVVRHRGPEIGAADPHVDNRANAPPRVASPLARPDALRERRHRVQHRVDLRDDVATVDDERPVTRHAESDVQCGSILGRVHVLAPVHRVASLQHAPSGGEGE
jgi:hypothetical protein